MKKALAIMLVALIAITSVMAQGAAASAPAASNGPTKVTYWAPLNSAITANDFSELAYWQELMARTNTEITFEHAPAANDGVLSEAFSVLMASGDWPDVIEWKWLDANPAKMIEDEVILPLNDIFEKYCPNITALLEKNPEIKKMISTEDGTYYCFPFLRNDSYVDNYLIYSEGWMYRLDLLQSVGIEAVPETPEELYTALVALKNAGIVEYPISIRKDHIDRVFAPGFDSWGEDGSFYVEDGVVKAGFIEPQRYDYLQYVHKLYAEKLLDNDYLSVDKKKMEANILNQQTAIGYAPGSLIANVLPKLRQENPAAEIVSAKPLSPEKGRLSMFAKMANLYPSGVSSSAAITTSCKNVEAVAKLLDYQYGEEGHLLANFGIEGVSYTMVNGVPTYTDLIVNNPEGKSPQQVMWQYCRASVNGPFVQDPLYQETTYTYPEQKEAIKLWAQTDYGKYIMPTTNVPAEYMDQYTKIMNDVKTFSDEMENKFITGALELTPEAFAAYVAQLKQLGIEKCVAWRQAGYDAYMAK